MRFCKSLIVRRFTKSHYEKRHLYATVEMPYKVTYHLIKSLHHVVYLGTLELTPLLSYQSALSAPLTSPSKFKSGKK